MNAPRRDIGKTFGLAMLGAALLWAALPPLDWGPLAWIAPIPWVLLIQRRELAGRRPYLALWSAGFLFWLAALHWLRLPHWAAAFGWLALAFYFAFYLPVFIGLARMAVHRLGVPVILAAPVVWTGLELARGHLLTGMTMASLGHTQYRWIELIQISDLAGAYGVGFLVMFVAACLARMIPYDSRRWAIWPLAPAALALAAALGYGYWRTANVRTQPGPRIALIQGSIDQELKADADRRSEVFLHYLDLSKEAARRHGPVDALVWPETMFRNPLVDCDDDAAVPKDFNGTRAELLDLLRSADQHSRQLMAGMARLLDAALILGVDAQHYGRQGTRYHNSAVQVDRSGRLLGRYDKMHLVMFGEYVPFAQYWNWLHCLTPLRVSVTAGTRPEVFELPVAGLAGAVRLSPSICYETVLPHVICRQVNALKARDREPDVLLNLTNDGWFHGSSELDMHLVCGVFRAVECRKPLVIAANTGFSAWIDGDGRVLAQGKRRKTDVLLAEVRLDGRRSPYLVYGDWPAGLCLAACGLFALVGGIEYIRRRKHT